MQISRLKKIQDTVQAFVDGESQLANIADALDEPLNKIYSLFSSNELIDPYSKIEPWITYQDIINTILLFYAMKPYHAFMQTSFGPPTTDYRRKPRKVLLPTKPVLPP